MNKTVFHILSAFALAGALSACQKQEAPASTEAPPAPAAEAVAPKPVELAPPAPMASDVAPAATPAANPAPEQAAPAQAGAK